jgi:hypothetical protein
MNVEIPPPLEDLTGFVATLGASFAATAYFALRDAEERYTKDLRKAEEE